MAALDKPDIDEVVIDYTNYKGERAQRRIMPLEIWFGRNAFHRTEQWLLRAYDLDKEDDREFAMKDIHSWRPA